MTDLQKFDAAAVADMAHAIGRELNDGTASLAQLQSSLSAFKFRDASAAYWTVAPRSHQWYRFEQGQWRPWNPPLGALDGPQPVSAWLIAARGRQPAAQRARPDTPVNSAPEFLQASVERTRWAYEQGDISSAEVEAELAGFYLLDRDGRIWTPGFRSRSWYFFAAGRWNHAGAGPAPASLLDLRETPSQFCAKCGATLRDGDLFCPKCGTPVVSGQGGISDQVGQAFAQFVELGLNTLPEPVAEPWQPPPGFPEMIRQCPVCGTTDVGNHTHCGRCRSLLPPPSARAQPPIAPAAVAGPSRSAPPSAPYPYSVVGPPGLPPQAPSGPTPYWQGAPPQYPVAGPPGPQPVYPPAYRGGAAPAAPAPRSRSGLWLALAGGCSLLFLLFACVMFGLWFAFDQGYIFRLFL